MLETTLGFRLGRVLKEVLVLLDVMNPMLLSVPTGDMASKVSDEDSVANEALLELSEAIAFSLSLLKVFFFLAALLFDFGFSATTFSCSFVSPSAFAGTSVSSVAVEVDFSSWTSLESAADLPPWIGRLSIDSERDLVGVAVGVGRAEVDLALIVSQIHMKFDRVC
jgi:hypothetical protein